ncbi:MAG TPA: hypothetical protein VH083_26895 [Myxococcales bacterium]|nr:hypothetical protein [Myxococcales bacterium]
MARTGDGERTMADAEADQGGTRCACGSERFVLEGYFEVEGGMLAPEPVEVEALTCPECGREYEPILMGSGRVTRGEFRGFFEEDE